MTLGLAYWVVMLVWVVLYFVHPPAHLYVLFLLFLLLGWQVFGVPLHR